MDGEDLRLSLTLRTNEIDRPISSRSSAPEVEMMRSHGPRSIEVDRFRAAATVKEEKDGVSQPRGEGSGSKREQSSVGHGGVVVVAVSDEEEGETTRKKLRLSKEQSAILEETFKEHNTLNPKQKFALAKRLNLRPRQVEVWFQNRRARTKLKQTEVDYEYLKRCCKNLTEENRRLQRELIELRALKRSPHFYMAVPATTLSMCPSCERLDPSEPHSRAHQIRGI